jgi:hypothetical protein
MSNSTPIKIASETKLPADMLAFLKTCPKAGSGVHRWLFIAALRLHKLNRQEPEIAGLLEAATTHCGRFVKAQEITNAIASSKRTLSAGGNESSALSRAPRWPMVNKEQVEAITKAGPGLDGFRELSPAKFHDAKPHTEEIIDITFPGNPLLCVGRSKFAFCTMLRQQWRTKLASRQLIVPSPMSSITGMTQDGKESMHTLANTGPRRFLVVEFDEGTFDQHAAILLHLAQFWPLALAVHSGGKSIHGWFYCAGCDEAQLKVFMRHAVSLGADPATWTKSQFVRMPDGLRDNGKRQEVIFFNPKELEAR